MKPSLLGYLMLIIGLMLLIGAVLTGALAFLPSAAHAHVKWFTEVEPVKEELTTILSPYFMIVTAATAVLLAGLTQLASRLTGWSLAGWIDSRMDLWRGYLSPLLKYGTAAALSLQAVSGSMFAPEFAMEHPIERALLWAAILCLLIPYTFATKAGALVALGLLLHLTARAGLFHMLDYVFYFAIVVVLVFERTRDSRLGFPLLYLGTGLSLCWVAVEKWVYPSMAADIIHHHQVPTFGFSPGAFIVLAGMIEFVVGYLLMVGLLNRLLAVALTLIFLSTTLLFGITELIGHFMIHIVLLMFIIEGTSFYKPPVELHRSRTDQMIFVSLNFLFVLSTFLLLYYRLA